jgi:hypothetical protein
MTVRRDAICTFRTLAPLTPVIPKGTPAVWASTKDCDVRRVLVVDDVRRVMVVDDVRSDIDDRVWRDGDGDIYVDSQLRDPVPVPPESEARS